MTLEVAVGKNSPHFCLRIDNSKVFLRSKLAAGHRVSLSFQIITNSSN